MTKCHQESSYHHLSLDHLIVVVTVMLRLAVARVCPTVTITGGRSGWKSSSTSGLSSTSSPTFLV